MKYIWIIKLKLKDEFREQIEEYFYLQDLLPLPQYIRYHTDQQNMHR